MRSAFYVVGPCSFLSGIKKIASLVLALCKAWFVFDRLN
jgi:hypothetical protein